jgi:hypothetical protein
MMTRTLSAVEAVEGGAPMMERNEAMAREF